MAEALSPADRSSLAAEVGPVTMAVGGVLIFAGGEGLRYERVLERVEARLHLIPQYRQRLRHPAPGVTNPVWVDDDHFDLRWHVRHTTLPQDGRSDAERLGDLVGTEMSRKLDRSRPLWELLVVDGLDDGKAALVPKMHHALVDGLAAVDIGTILLDAEAEPAEQPEPEAWEPRPYDRNRHLRQLGLTPAVRAQKLLFEGAQRALRIDAPVRAAGDLKRATDLLIELARTRPAAPMTPLNRGIGPNRRYALERVPLAAIKQAGKASGGTVNDAILAAVTGMIARYCEAAGGLPERSPVALVPVSVRQDGEAGGNRISTVLVDLPIAEPTPAARVAAINVSMRKIKDSAAVRAGALMVGASGWAPPLVSSTLARAMSGVRAFNIVVSNVPGPQMPFYMNGSRLLAVHPCVPLNPATQGLTVGILSYDGNVCFGLLADRDLDPGLPTAAAALRESIDELLLPGG